MVRVSENAGDAGKKRFSAGWLRKGVVRKKLLRYVFSLSFSPYAV
jgi:hypothetical protein